MAYVPIDRPPLTPANQENYPPRAPERVVRTFNPPPAVPSASTATERPFPDMEPGVFLRATDKLNRLHDKVMTHAGRLARGVTGTEHDVWSAQVAYSRRLLPLYYNVHPIRNGSAEIGGKLHPVTQSHDTGRITTAEGEHRFGRVMGSEHSGSLTGGEAPQGVEGFLLLPKPESEHPKPTVRAAVPRDPGPPSQVRGQAPELPSSHFRIPEDEELDPVSSPLESTLRDVRDRMRGGETQLSLAQGAPGQGFSVEDMRGASVEKYVPMASEPPEPLPKMVNGRRAPVVEAEDKGPVASRAINVGEDYVGGGDIWRRTSARDTASEDWRPQDFRDTEVPGQLTFDDPRLSEQIEQATLKSHVRHLASQGDPAAIEALRTGDLSQGNWDVSGAGGRREEEKTAASEPSFRTPAAERPTGPYKLSFNQFLKATNAHLKMVGLKATSEESRELVNRHHRLNEIYPWRTTPQEMAGELYKRHGKTETSKPLYLERLEKVAESGAGADLTRRNVGIGFYTEEPLTVQDLDVHPATKDTGHSVAEVATIMGGSDRISTQEMIAQIKKVRPPSEGGYTGGMELFTSPEEQARRIVGEKAQPFDASKTGNAVSHERQENEKTIIRWLNTHVPHESFHQASRRDMNHEATPVLMAHANEVWGPDETAKHLFVSRAHAMARRLGVGPTALSADLLGIVQHSVRGKGLDTRTVRDPETGMTKQVEADLHPYTREYRDDTRARREQQQAADLVINQAVTGLGPDTPYEVARGAVAAARAEADEILDREPATRTRGRGRQGTGRARIMGKQASLDALISEPPGSAGMTTGARGPSDVEEFTDIEGRGDTPESILRFTSSGKLVPEKAEEAPKVFSEEGTKSDADRWVDRIASLPEFLSGKFSKRNNHAYVNKKVLRSMSVDQLDEWAHYVTDSALHPDESHPQHDLAQQVLDQTKGLKQAGSRAASSVLRSLFGGGSGVTTASGAPAEVVDPSREAAGNQALHARFVSAQGTRERDRALDAGALKDVPLSPTTGLPVPEPDVGTPLVDPRFLEPTTKGEPVGAARMARADLAEIEARRQGMYRSSSGGFRPPEVLFKAAGARTPPSEKDLVEVADLMKPYEDELEDARVAHAVETSMLADGGSTEARVAAAAERLKTAQKHHDAVKKSFSRSSTHPETGSTYNAPGSLRFIVPSFEEKEEEAPKPETIQGAEGSLFEGLVLTPAGGEASPGEDIAAARRQQAAQPGLAHVSRRGGRSSSFKEGQNK